MPRKRVSLHQALVFGFYTDQVSVNDDLFHGTYEFIDASTLSLFTRERLLLRDVLFFFADERGR